MIYADFESILVPEDNGKKNSEESCTSKYQKYISCSCGHKLICVDKFTRPFKTYSMHIAVTTWENISRKNLWWLRKAIKILKNLLNVGSGTMIMLIMMLKYEIIVISPKYVEALRIEIVIPALN